MPVIVGRWYGYGSGSAATDLELWLRLQGHPIFRAIPILRLFIDTCDFQKLY